MRSTILLLCVIIFSSQANAQFFKKGDRVTFVGNSITHNGDYWHNVALYYTTRHPQLGVTFYNCGISGDVTSGILNRMETDILIHNPTCAVIMIGMNDVNRSLYDEKKKNDAGIKDRQQAALVTYKTNLDSIIRIFLSKNIKVVLQTPSIYDQTARLATANLYGVNDALKTCAGYIREFAAKYKLQVVDYWTMMTAINKEIQLKDTMATIVGNDRVHPGPAGHLLMGWEFLKTIKATPVVATIVADRDGASSKSKSQQADITGFKRDAASISFTATEKSLPFPLREDQLKALELAPVTDNLNKELLRFNFLAPGNYTLFIDDKEIGKYFSGELERGINLAMIPAAPQYVQAQKVRELMSRSWALEAQIRGLRLVEYRMINNLPAKDLATVKNFYDTGFAKRPETDYLRNQLRSYIERKPNEADIIAKWKVSLDSLPILTKAIPHRYLLKKD